VRDAGQDGLPRSVGVIDDLQFERNPVRSLRFA